MTYYVPAIAVDAVIDALAAFIQPFVGTAPIVRGQVNRVAPPHSPFVKLTEMRSVNLQIPHAEYFQVAGANSAAIHGPQRVDIQVDFYGEASGDYCNAVKAGIENGWGWDQFPTGLRPLYASDGIQAPLITGEEQYEQRWTMTVSMQINQNFTTPQQYASNATATLRPADALTTDEV